MRCRLHDETPDPDTGRCDRCEKDALLDCPACDGEGVTYTRHPAWGRPWCPDDYIETHVRTVRGRRNLGNRTRPERFSG